MPLQKKEEAGDWREQEIIWSAAMRAVEHDDAKELLSILSRHPFLKRRKGQKEDKVDHDYLGDFSLFHLAAMDDKPACAMALINDGWSINDPWRSVAGSLAFTPLSLAIKCKNLAMRSEIVEAMLAKAPRSVGEEARHWKLAMEAAGVMAATHAMEKIRTHLGENADHLWPDCLDRQGKSLWHSAAINGSIEMLDLLMGWPGMPAIADAKDRYGGSPAQLAKDLGNEDFLRKFNSRIFAWEESVEIAGSMRETARKKSARRI